MLLGQRYTKLKKNQTLKERNSQTAIFITATDQNNMNKNKSPDINKGTKLPRNKYRVQYNIGL